MAINSKYAILADKAAMDIRDYYKLEIPSVEKKLQKLIISARIYRALKEAEESQEEKKEETTTRYFAVYYTTYSKRGQAIGLAGVESEIYPALKQIKERIKNRSENRNLENFNCIPTNIVEMTETDYKNLFSLNEKEEEK